MLIAKSLSTGALAPSGGAGPADCELEFERGVPRTLVHKTAVSEVLATDAVRTGPNRFTVAAQWPQLHVLFGDGMCPAGTADPLLLLETVRQAGIYVSHVYYDVPLSHPFLLTSIDYEVEPLTSGFAARGGPHNVLLDVRCAVEHRAANRLGMSLEARLSIDGHTVGRAGLCWQAVAPERYTRVRFPVGRGQDAVPPTVPGSALPTVTDPVAAPHVLGRAHDRDVMLSALPANSGSTDHRESDSDTWSLRLDTTHPVYFDHGCDHIPGMALAESFSQAAALAAGRAAGIPTDQLRWAVESGALSFVSFGELREPVVITADPVPERPDHSRRAVRVSARQDGRLIAHGAFVVATSQAVEGGTR